QTALRPWAWRVATVSAVLSKPSISYTCASTVVSTVPSSWIWNDVPGPGCQIAMAATAVAIAAITTGRPVRRPQSARAHGERSSQRLRLEPARARRTPRARCLRSAPPSRRRGSSTPSAARPTVLTARRPRGEGAVFRCAAQLQLQLRPRSSRGQPLAKQLVHGLRIGLALRLLHHLADEEAEQALLARAVVLDLGEVRGENGVDQRRELRRLRDGDLLEQVVDRLRADEPHSLLEGSAGDPAAGAEELRELSGVDRAGVAAGRREGVHDDVRSVGGVGPGGDGAFVEAGAAGRHEPDGRLVVERGLETPDPRAGRFGQLRAQPVDQRTLRDDGHEVGLGKVAVVLRLFLRPVRRERVALGVVVVCLLDDLAAALVDRDLLADRGLDPTPDERERVHVLQLPARSEARLPGRADGHVDVAAKRPFLHLGVRDPELDDCLPEQPQEPRRLLGRPDVRLGDDLDERRAAAVEVDEGAGRADDPAAGAGDVDGSRRVLLEVRSNDADGVIAPVVRDDEAPAGAERRVVLGDLVPLGQVRIEVVLPVEDGARRDLAAEREAELHRPLDRLPVRDRERARVGEADRAGVRVLRVAEARLAAAEHL